MLTENNRKKLLGVLEQMGVDPRYVDRDGASYEGYRTFVFDPSERQEDGSRLTRFVLWTPYQLDKIFENNELFEPWFNETPKDETTEPFVITAEELVANFSQYGTKVEVVSEHVIAGIHPAPGRPMEFTVTLRFSANV